MAKNLPLVLFLTMLTITNPITMSASSPPPPPPPLPPPPPPPLPPADQNLHQQQVNNIIDALIGTGDFSSWANMLSDTAGSSTTTLPLPLPLSATLFVPEDEALNSTTPTSTPPLILDPFTFPYHIVPQRLSFSDLLLFKTHSRLPTLFPSKSILITNNSRSNFTLDDSPITYPDLYTTSTIAVHGIAAVLDYSVYGGDGLSLPPPEPLEVVTPPPGICMPPGEIVGRRWSDAACLCTEFPIVFSVVCAVLAFKIQGNPFSLMGLLR